MHAFIIYSCLATVLTNNTYTYQEAIRNEDINPTVILTLSLNLNGGNELILSDQTHWIVNPNDTEISSLWLSTFPIQVLKGESEDYPATLLNTLSLQKVRVTPASKDLSSAPNS